MFYNFFGQYFFHDTVIWNFSDISVTEYVTVWNTSVRHLFHLLYQTDRRFLPMIVEVPTMIDQIYCRFIKICAMKDSNNIKVIFLYDIGMSNAGFKIRKNLYCIEKRLHIKIAHMFYFKE
jgi:hypothetical protein